MSTQLFFNGRLTAKPGAYSKVDASAFESAALAASGIVALVATGVGGKPYTAIASPNDDLQRATNSGQIRRAFRFGDLREMGAILFNPAKDPEIQAGAQQVVLVKVNPAAQSQADFANSGGTALRIKSADYGAFTTQISVQIANATSGGGKLVTIKFEDDTEAFDLLGNDAKFSLLYSGGSDGATAIQGHPNQSAFVPSFTQPPAASSIEVVSSSALDTTQTVTVYGLNASNVPTATTVTLNGLTAVAVPGTWNAVNDAKGSAAFQGQVTIRIAAAGATIASSQFAFQVPFTRADAGQDASFTQAPGASALEIVSSNAADTTQVVTVYGLDASNVPQSQSATLNGTTAVAVAGTWNLETAVVMSATALGTMTLRIAGGGATVATLTAGQTNKGRVALDIAATGFHTVQADGATTRKVVYRGLNAVGSAIAEVLTLSGATPVVFAGAFAKFTSVEVGNIESARTATLTSKVFNAASVSHPTIQKLKDLVAANVDFTFTVIVGNPTEYLLADLDYVAAQNILSPTTASFYARLADIVAELNAKSQLVTAERVSPGTGAPSNTSSQVFLAGGHEGDAGQPGVVTATASDWQNAIDKLKQVFVNTLVLGTDSAAVHAMGVAHCEFMGGAGKMERDIVMGAAANETVAQLKARALALNSRHARLATQEVSLFNTDGERVFQPPKFQAALAAGMQAGTSVGNPLTNKYANILGLRQHSSWNPIDNVEELLAAGLFVMQFDEGKGFKVVRNLTTYLKDNNLAYSEASVNQATNYSVFVLRSRMETIIGKKGFARTVQAAAAAADGVLESLVRDEILAAYKKPTFELALDVLRMELEISPIAPINFIPIVVNLKPFSLAA
jgi:hypothetical protein